jgi:hypothetical protein
MASPRNPSAARFVACACAFSFGVSTARAEPPLMRERSAKAAVSTESDDGRVSLSLGGFLQARAQREVALGGRDAEDAAAETAPIVSLPRMRFYAFGHVHEDTIRYRLMMGASGVGGTVQVLDAYLEKRFAHALHLRAGVFKIPVYRAWIESARLMSSVERAYATTAFLPGREGALMASGELAGEEYQYAVALVNGAAAGATSAEPAGAARVVWNPMGRVIEGEIDFDDQPATLSIGANALVNRRVVQAPAAVSAPGLQGVEDALGVEVSLRARGFDLSGEAMVRDRRRDDGLRTRSFGAYVRADQYVASIASSFGGRVSLLAGDDAGTPDRRDYELDYGFYPGRHDLKLNVEVGYVDYVRADVRAVEGAAQVQVAF